MLSWTFAGLSIYSVWRAWQHKQQRALAGKGVQLHAPLITAANVAVLAYLGYCGMNGLRFWASLVKKPVRWAR